MKPVGKVLERAEDVRETGSGWLASCPLPDHGLGRGDRNPSVSVSEGDDGRVLLSCKAGCETEALVEAWGLSMSDLFENRNGRTGAVGVRPGGGHKVFGSNPRDGTATLQRCTLEEYAEAKKLPVAHLKGLGLRDAKYQGSQAVRIPYHSPDGSETAVRYRLALEKSGEGDLRFKWRSGSKTSLYGLERLEEARARPDTWRWSRARATRRPSGITASPSSASQVWIPGSHSGRITSKASKGSTRSWSRTAAGRR